jgi:hypothetical protein
MKKRPTSVTVMNPKVDGYLRRAKKWQEEIENDHS